MHNTSAFLQVTVVLSINSLTIEHINVTCSMQDKNSSVTFIPSIVKTVAGVGKVDFFYLSDNFRGNTTVQMKPSFIASDTVIIPKVLWYITRSILY